MIPYFLCATALWMGVMNMAAAAEPARLEAGPQGGFAYTSANYQAVVGKDGCLTSLKAGGTEFLSAPATFVHAGQFVPLKSVKQTGPDTLVAEGDSGTGSFSPPSGENVPVPLRNRLRVAYHFEPDRIELTLEQGIVQYGGFAWVPSPSVSASRDALTDCAQNPGEPALYGQTDPRWTTKEGPVLRFDFGVWQKGFANATWAVANVGGKPVHYMQGTVPSGRPMKAVAYPIANPSPKDALAFDISAAEPNFLLPGGQPVHFDIKVTNAGPTPTAALVRFEVRDYLTQQPVAARASEIKLAGKADTPLPTDVAIEKPGPYRAAIVIEEAGKIARSFWWVFTYDFQNYDPPTTRPPDFEQFWKDALAESAATPLDAKLTPVPEKGNANFDAFKISYATLGGRRIYGWYSRPKAPGKYSAHVRFPSSGIYPLAGPELRPDCSSLWIGIHGFDVDLSNMPRGDDPGKNYWTAGIESPKASMWRTIYISLVRAVDFMAAQPEVDPKRIAVTGGSQGGGLSMVAAALDHRIAFCLPFHSGLPRLDWTVKYQPGYWPFGMPAKPKDQTEERFLKTLSYFDPANLTQDIQCQVVAEIGLMDTVTAAGNQICALAHVPKGRLHLICSPWAMHGAGSRAPGLSGEYYNRFLKGEKINFHP